MDPPFTQTSCNRRRFTGMDSTLLWVSMLNPIFVKLNHLSDTEKEMVRRKVKQLMFDQHEALSKHQVPEDSTKHRGHGSSTGSSTMMTLFGEESEDESSDSDNDRNSFTTMSINCINIDFCIMVVKRLLRQNANKQPNVHDGCLLMNVHPVGGNTSSLN